jgi:hypothetical protein
MTNVKIMREKRFTSELEALEPVPFLILERAFADFGVVASLNTKSALQIPTPKQIRRLVVS